MLYGYQGSDTDAEQLALTEQLFDAALAELAVVAWVRLVSWLAVLWLRSSVSVHAAIGCG